MWSLVVVDHTSEGIERITNEALVIVEDWIRANRLELAHSKTEDVILTRNWAFSKAKISVSNR